jgi:hypothetical protein
MYLNLYNIVQFLSLSFMFIVTLFIVVIPLPIPLLLCSVVFTILSIDLYQCIADKSSQQKRE